LLERVGETMLHVETTEELDPDLLRSLAGIVNRQGLMLTLEESRINKEASAREKADRMAEEERIRWTPPQFQLGDFEDAASLETQATSLDTSAIQQLGMSQQSAANHESINEDEGLFNFLQDEPTPPAYTPALPPAPSQPSQPSQPTPQPKIRTTRSAPPNDPEVQYQRLQEQLGIVQPSEPEPEPEPVAPFGAGLGFKSVLSKWKEATKVEPVVRARRVVPRVSIRRTRSNVRFRKTAPRVV
jgi:hypothetical protein